MKGHKRAKNEGEGGPKSITSRKIMKLKVSLTPSASFGSMFDISDALELTHDLTRVYTSLFLSPTKLVLHSGEVRAL